MRKTIWAIILLALLSLGWTLADGLNVLPGERVVIRCHYTELETYQKGNAVTILCAGKDNGWVEYAPPTIELEPGDSLVVNCTGRSSPIWKEEQPMGDTWVWCKPLTQKLYLSVVLR